MKQRKEFDSIGSINVPNDKYWGASTQRSNKFFNIGFEFNIWNEVTIKWTELKININKIKKNNNNNVGNVPEDCGEPMTQGMWWHIWTKNK